MAVTTFFIEKKNPYNVKILQIFGLLLRQDEQFQMDDWTSMFQIPFVCTIIWCKEEVYEEGLEIKKKEVYEFAFLEGLQKLVSVLTNPECKWY